MKFVNERDSPRTCPVCGATSPSVHAGEGAGSFLRCAACGSLYLAAAPDLAALHALYQSPTYHDGRGHSGDEAIEATKTVTARMYLRLLERCRPPGRRYLEVGCSTGAHLSAAASAGWEAQGIEISTAAWSLRSGGSEPARSWISVSWFCLTTPCAGRRVGRCWLVNWPWLGVWYPESRQR